MNISKGGLVGFPYIDFDKRQKSGSWNISEHQRNVNYIRDKKSPNDYLILGCYDDSELILYDLFFDKKLSTNSFRLQGIVFSIDFNRENNLLAIALDKAPYLRIFSTEDFSEIIITDTINTPINFVKFNNLGTKLFVSHITDTQPFLSIYDTINFTLLSDLAAIQITKQITNINLNISDRYLLINHYDILNK